MLISCMILAFFVFSWYQSGFDQLTDEQLQERSQSDSGFSPSTVFADLTGTFPQFMGSQLIWLTILLACLGVSAGEIILRYLQDYWEQEERDKYDAINEE